MEEVISQIEVPVFLSPPVAIRLPVDATVYSVQAILRTAYWMTDSCYILVTRPAKGQYVVHFAPKAGIERSLESLAGEFSNALIDNQLRVELSEQSGKVRDLIVAKAFAEGNLLEDPVPGSTCDPVEAGVHWNQLAQREVV